MLHNCWLFIPLCLTKIKDPMKILILLLLSTVLLFSSCKKLNKKAMDALPGRMYEITSVTVDGVERLDEFYQDSCFCKNMFFSKTPQYKFGGKTYDREFTVYFSDCNGKTVDEEFPSIGSYGISESTVSKPRKYAFMNFYNFSHSDPTCTCGRFGYARYYTIVDFDKKTGAFTYSVDLPGGKWEVKLKTVK